MEKFPLFCILKKTRNEGGPNWDTCTGKFIEEDESTYYVAWCGNFVAESSNDLSKLMFSLEKNYKDFKYVLIDARGWKI